MSAASRLEQLPRFLEQARGELVANRVPKIHAETAIAQNAGLNSIIENMIVPQMSVLSSEQQEQLNAAIEMARNALADHQTWLEEELLPKATGDFRIGAELYDTKLAFALSSPLSRKEITARAEQEYEVESFLREYNLYSLQDLTIHEGVPGHYLQIALSNRHPSVLRSVLYSGPFVEGWAVYAEGMMIDEGYQDNDPLQRLITLKWYLRAITNAIIDSAIHVDGMTREAAMNLMVEGGFQEEREAAGKWVRAQLTSAQLSTYFVGYQEHIEMRAAVEKLWGDEFTLRRYHDQALSYGSPPVRFVRALMLDEEIPRRGE